MLKETSFIPVAGPGVEPRLLCPICSGTYVRPVAITCTPPGANCGELIVDFNGVHLDPAVQPHDRGVLVTLRFWCERGHAFTYVMQFHKGETFVGKTMEVPHDVEPVIWRN
jgi:hypothetical protein